MGKMTKLRKDEINTNSIYSSDYGIGNGYQFMNNNNNGRSSLNCVAFGNGRYRNFGGIGVSKGDYESDVAVTTGIAHRNRFYLGHYNSANSSKLSASFGLFYNFRHDDLFDRFSFPSPDPHYLPPVERCVPGRQVDFFCPLMDSGEETVINQTTIMSKGMVVVFRPGMTISLSPLNLSIVLDSAFEPENIVCAARDPVMDLLFSNWISDSICARKYSCEYDTLMKDGDFRKLLYLTWRNYPNTECARGEPHTYGLQFSCVPKNSKRTFSQSFNSQSGNLSNNRSNKYNNGNRNDSNLNNNDSRERKEDSPSQRKEKRKEKQTFRFVNMDGRITVMEVDKKEEEEKEEKEKEKEREKKKEKDKSHGHEHIGKSNVPILNHGCDSIAATVVIDSEDDDTGSLVLQNSIYTKQGKDTVARLFQNFQHQENENNDADGSDGNFSNGKLIFFCICLL